MSGISKVFPKAPDQLRPEVSLHLAAQPRISQFAKGPGMTFSWNALGAVSVLEFARISNCPIVDQIELLEGADLDSRI